MAFESDDYVGTNLLSQFKSCQTLTEQLNFIMPLLYSLDTDTKKLFDGEIRKFERLELDVDFMRAIKHRDSLIQDFSTEYFGQDFGSDDPFLYDKELETQIARLSLELMSILGRVINVMKKEQILIPDEE